MNANKYSYFENHPKAKEFHFTSDGLAFHEPHHAHAHSSHLKDKEVATHTRAEAEAWAENQKGEKNVKTVTVDVEKVSTGGNVETGGEKTDDDKVAEQVAKVLTAAVNNSEVVAEAKQNTTPAPTGSKGKKAAEAKPAAPKKTANKKAANK